MGLGSDLGKNIGEPAAQEIHRAIDGAIPEAQRAADEIINRVASGIVTQLTGAITQAFGSLEVALGGFPESLVSALDGLTVTITVNRKK